MTPAYDIGIGCCSEIDGDRDLVSVRLDALIAKRLAPQAPWSRSGTSVLRLQRTFCSKRRPPQVGEELYLDAPAEFDVLGDGRFERTDLKIILCAMTPIQPAPAPGVKASFLGRGN